MRTMWLFLVASVGVASIGLTGSPAKIVPSGSPKAIADGGVQGRVLDAQREPCANVRVILGELGRALLIYNTPGEMFVTTPGIPDPESKRWRAELSTDREGKFVATGLAPGEFSLIAGDAHGLAVTTVRIEGGANAAPEIVLAPPAFVEAEINGHAYDPQRDTIEILPVGQGSNITFVPRLTQRDRQWSFESAPLPVIAGGWRLIGAEVVTEQDYRATLFAQPVSVVPGGRTRLMIDLEQGYDITGTVSDASGQPLSGASVVARTAPSIERGAVSDAKGRYRVRGLGDGAYTLELARWKMRELPGCGNGSQDVFASKSIQLPADKGKDVDFRVETLLGAPAQGDLAPTFTARTIDGKDLDLAALRGKIVLIDFWATWCGMCRSDMPSLVETYERCAREGRFEIIGVSVDTDLGLVPRFVASRSLRWPQTALGGAAKNPIARLYNVNSTPATVLIDREGRIAALNLTGETLRKKVEELLRAR